MKSSYVRTKLLEAYNTTGYRASVAVRENEKKHYHLKRAMVISWMIMERKISVCHVCGAEVKCFADHMAGANKQLNYKKQKLSYRSTVLGSGLNCSSHTLLVTCCTLYAVWTSFVPLWNIWACTRIQHVHEIIDEHLWFLDISSRQRLSVSANMTTDKSVWAKMASDRPCHQNTKQERKEGPAQLALEPAQHTLLDVVT